MKISIKEIMKDKCLIGTTIKATEDSFGEEREVPFYDSQFAKKYSITRWDNVPLFLNPLKLTGNIHVVDLYRNAKFLSLSLHIYMIVLREINRDLGNESKTKDFIIF